jgi:type II secretory pathway pseudopilin PulG
MNSRTRAAFTLFQLLVVLALLGVLLGLLLPAIAKVRAAAARQKKLNNLKQIGIACHNYHDVTGAMPSGNNDNNFSASAFLLPYVEQDNLYRKIDFKKPSDDKANAPVRGALIVLFLNPDDPIKQVSEGAGPTNYLFNAGSEPSLTKNNGVLFQNSKVKLAEIVDGTSNTLMVGETLKGDGGKAAKDVKRQHVSLKAADLKDIKETAGVQDWKDNKNIAGDRCAAWIDGRFLQGTFTATRSLNAPEPDVNCGGEGGLSALRNLEDAIAVALCDGSARTISAKKMKLETWKLLANRMDGQVINFSDF